MDLTNIPTEKVIAAIVALFIAACGGTFALMKFFGEKENAYLQRKLGDAEGIIKRLEFKQSLQGTPTAMTTIAAGAIASQGGPESLGELNQRVAKLEEERQKLIVQLSQQVTASLDPASEIGNLVRLLKSDDKKLRSTAAASLMKFRDPIVVSPMLEFYTRERKLGDAPAGISYSEWLDFFYRLAGPASMTVIVESLVSENDRERWAAESVIEYSVKTKESIDALVQQLKVVALSHGESTTRATAKLLLEKLRMRLENTDRDSLVSLAKQPENLEPSNYFKLSTLLKKCGLPAGILNLRDDGLDVTYWKTAVTLYEFAGKRPELIPNVCSAYERLSQLEMAPNSKATAIYLWAKLERKRGDQTKAATLLSDLGKQFPLILASYQDNDGVFEAK